MMATEAGNAAIAAMYEDDYGQPGVAAEETPIAQPQAAVEAEEAQQEAAPEPPDPEDSAVPPDIQALLDEPDFEAEAEQEFVPEEEEDEVYLDESDALAKERKARLAAEKELKWLKDKRVESEGKRWAEEAEKYFPLSAPFMDKIQGAGSRRAFLRAAHDYHDRALKASEKVSPSAPATDREAIKAELRAELEAAWGKPVVGPGKAPVESAEKAAAIEEARNKRDLLGIQRARGTTQKIWGNLYDHAPEE